MTTLKFKPVEVSDQPQEVDAFEREILRKCLDETIAQARCDKANADDEIKETAARMKALSKAYFEAKAENAAAVGKWNAAHDAECRAERRLATLLESDSRRSGQ